MLQNKILHGLYIKDYSALKTGTIVYGKSGKPMKVLSINDDLLVVESKDGSMVRIPISAIKLIHNSDYGAFGWVELPGQRWDKSRAGNVQYSPYHTIAIGAWTKPAQETRDDGTTGNKRVTDAAGNKRAIPDRLREIWVDESKIDLNYQPLAPTPVDNVPATIEPWETVKRIYLDIETTGLNPETCRVIAIGLMNEAGKTRLLTDPDESVILDKCCQIIQAYKPSLIFTHNGYKFDIPFIIYRCIQLGINPPFEEFDRKIWRQIKKNAHGALKRVFEVDKDNPTYGGSCVAFTANDGESIVMDTMILLGLRDTQKKLSNLKLKPSTIELKLRDDSRLELTNDEIQECWRVGDINNLLEYLKYDLEDTELLANYLMSPIWYQQSYLPDTNLIQLAYKNTGFKVQAQYEYLCPDIPEALAVLSKDRDALKDSIASYGGGLNGALTGLFPSVAKIDVASLYPSIMVRYRLGSRKDTEGKYIAVLSRMLTDRLYFKSLGKSGDWEAASMAEAIKLLMNSGYGFLGNQGYTFNDYESAALITAYGRVILRLMGDTITHQGGKLISADTDGIYFSHLAPKLIFDRVQSALPTGINIELELADQWMFSLSMKNYCLYDNNGKLLQIKGNSLLSNRFKLDDNFVAEYPKLIITEGQASADSYYRQIINDLKHSRIPLELLTIEKDIRADHTKKIIELNIDCPGRYTVYWCRCDVHPNRLKYLKVRRYTELNVLATKHPDIPYWGEFYAYNITCLRANILGIEDHRDNFRNIVKPVRHINKKIKQTSLFH